MMQAQEDHGKAPRRFPPWVILVCAAALVAAVLVVVHVVGSPSKPHNSASSTDGHGKVSEASHSVAPLYVTATEPLSKATDVPSNTPISVTFSAPISLHGVLPTLSPDVGGSWVQTSPTVLTFNLNGPLIPGTTELITIPGGTSGVRSVDHRALLSAASFSFTVAPGDVTRLQQLLADLNYMPVSFAPSGPAPAAIDQAIAQPGSFGWRWPSLPAELTSQWTQGSMNEITKAAIEAFEADNGLGVDGIAGPAVWTALLNDTVSDKVATKPYVYVLVNKVQPETLTLYDNGAVQFANILVNTGAPGADTADGSFVVFEHVTSSEMKGTNPDGSKYDDPDVPWASYFNGGDALHGFVRAHYGYPQSNGCVEMPVATAGEIWPYTPIGTLVTVTGPSSGAGPPPTTTTVPPPTTTVPPPPATTTTVPA